MLWMWFSNFQIYIRPLFWSTEETKNAKRRVAKAVRYGFGDLVKMDFDVCIKFHGNGYGGCGGGNEQSGKTKQSTEATCSD